MAWYDSAVFYHIYPLGLCGCPHENTGECGSKFDIITEWTAHARDLGCNALYIGPLFESGSHGYDTIDYRRVDRRLGTNDDFKAFVADCHANGMKVIVDGVFNHVGRGFFAFADLKQNREQSAYKDWFCNVNFWGNNEYNDGFCYDNWGGFNLLVKLNLWNPEVKQYHFDTVRFWIEEFDIDGIRLDAADVLDMGFMRELRGFCDSMKPEFWLMGEVIHGDYSRWVNPQMLHSVTNYELHKALYSGHNSHNYFEIAHTVRRLNGLVGEEKLYTFTDNHDVARIASKLNNPAHMVNVALLQYALPGIPSIYYGSEFGIAGQKERGSDWNLRPELHLKDFNEDDELPVLFGKLGKLKADFPQLTYGEYRELTLTTEQYSFARVLDGKAIVVALNNADNQAHLEIPLPVNASRAVDLLAMPVETEEERAAKEAEAKAEAQKRLADLQGMLGDKAGQLVGASGEIRQKSENIRNMLAHADFVNNDVARQLDADLQALWNTMDNMQRVIHEFTDAAGMARQQAPQPQIAQDAKGFELRDGKLIVDLPGNAGKIIYLE